MLFPKSPFPQKLQLKPFSNGTVINIPARVSNFPSQPKLFKEPVAHHPSVCAFAWHQPEDSELSRARRRARMDDAHVLACDAATWDTVLRLSSSALLATNRDGHAPLTAGFRHPKLRCDPATDAGDRLAATLRGRMDADDGVSGRTSGTCRGSRANIRERKQTKAFLRQYMFSQHEAS